MAIPRRARELDTNDPVAGWKLSFREVTFHSVRQEFPFFLFLSLSLLLDRGIDSLLDSLMLGICLSDDFNRILMESGLTL